MPKKVDEIRRAILRDNPGISEKSSWAMAYAAYNRSLEKTAGQTALALEQFARKVDHLIRGMRGETPQKLMAQHRLGQCVRKGSELLEVAMQAQEKHAAFGKKFLGRFGEGSVSVLNLPNIGKVIRKRWHSGLTDEINKRLEMMSAHPEVFPKVYGTRGNSTYFEFIDGKHPHQGVSLKNKLLDKLEASGFTPTGGHGTLSPHANSVIKKWYRESKTGAIPGWFGDKSKTRFMTDLKPKNMVETPSGDLKIVDVSTQSRDQLFGSAKLRWEIRNKARMNKEDFFTALYNATQVGEG